MSTSSIRLSELANQVKATLSAGFTEPVWVVAEIHEMNVNRTGHCYLELVEKDEASDKLLAKIRATIWSYTFRVLRPYFESTTGYRFDSGIKVMFKVAVVFHELYGFSLNITDVDPNYTLGDIARRRQEIIRQLQEDGVMELNKDVEMPEMPQRIAVISSPTAAGYGDFADQLHHNEQGYVFYTVLFKATMQGDGTEASVISALERIYEHEEHFDAVVIIRGGGSKSDLAAFDTYDLAYNVAQFPLPVLAGIGHERDESVVDLVSHQSLKTPTAVAEFLIDMIDGTAKEINELEQDLIATASQFVEVQKDRVERVYSKLSPLVNAKLSAEKIKIEKLEQKLNYVSTSFLTKKKTVLTSLVQHLKFSLSKRLDHENEIINKKNERLKSASLGVVQQTQNRLNLLSNSIRHLDPQKLLDRGYSMTLLDGKLVSSTKNVKKGKVIVTRVSDGEIESEVL